MIFTAIAASTIGVAIGATAAGLATATAIGVGAYGVSQVKKVKQSFSTSCGSTTASSSSTDKTTEGTGYSSP